MDDLHAMREKYQLCKPFKCSKKDLVDALKIIHNAVVDVHLINNPIIQVVSMISLQLTIHPLKVIKPLKSNWWRTVYTNLTIKDKQEDVPMEDFTTEDLYMVKPANNPIVSIYLICGPMFQQLSLACASYLWPIQSRWSGVIENPYPLVDHLHYLVCQLLIF